MDGSIQEKSEWQKDNCINPKCDGKAEYELLYRHSLIRFCGKLECLEVAKELASHQLFEDSIKEE